MPARVLFYYSSHQLDTGSPRVLLNLVDSLDRRRFQPLFWATGTGPLVDALAARQVDIVDGSAGAVSLRQPLNAFRAAWAVRARLRQLKIALLHFNEFGWNCDLAIGAWLARVPVLFHFHNPYEVDARNLHRFIAAKVLLVSEAERLQIRGFDRIRSKAEVLYNSVDLDAFARGLSQRCALGIASDRCVIGTVAQISRRKGIDVLLDAARKVTQRHPHVLFIVVGPPAKGEEAFAIQMIDATKESALAGRFRFLGSREDIPDLLATMDIFCLPSRAEPFGMAVTEALAAGLPVVATGVGGIPEILRPGTGITVSAGSSCELADALSRLVDDLALRARLGENGRASLVGRFDRQSVTARLHEIYEQLVDSASNRRT